MEIQQSTYKRKMCGKTFFRIKSLKIIFSRAFFRDLRVSSKKLTKIFRSTVYLTKQKLIALFWWNQIFKYRKAWKIYSQYLSHREMYIQDFLLFLLLLGFTDSAFVLHENQGILTSLIRTSHAWNFEENK